MKKNRKLINTSNSIYNHAAAKHGISSESVLWSDQQTQYYRFYELVKHLDLCSKNKTILDIGCGNAELFKFINYLGYRGKYTGFDINKILIKQAKERFKNINVQVADINSIKKFKKYDYVVMSGLFNLHFGQDTNWIKLFLTNMFRHTKEVLVFNAISTHVSYVDKSMFYLDPAEILTFCIDHLSRRVTLEHHNLPYNYTISVYRDEKWSSIKTK